MIKEFDKGASLVFGGRFSFGSLPGQDVHALEGVHIGFADDGL